MRLVICMWPGIHRSYNKFIKSFQVDMIRYVRSDSKKTSQVYVKNKLMYEVGCWYVVRNMFRSRYEFCDILAIPFFRPNTMCSYEVNNLKFLQIAPIFMFLHSRKRTSSWGYFFFLQLTSMLCGSFLGYPGEVTAFTVSISWTIGATLYIFCMCVERR